MNHVCYRLLAALALSLVAGCRDRGTPATKAGGTEVAASAGSIGIRTFTAKAIGDPAEGQAWITDLTIADLDRDGLPDVVCCDAKRNQVCWIRQTARGEFHEQPLGEAIAGPAHVDVIDFDGDGDLDVLVAGMGIVTPNNDKLGSVVILENDGHQHFRNQVVLDHTYRVTDVRAADFNGDGKLDLSIAQFGYIEGAVQWLENRGDGQFTPHPLLEVGGPIHAPVVDFNRDGKPDIVALVAQDWEEVWGFESSGNGTFSKRVFYGSTNKDFGSSGLTVADVNRDGWPDLVSTNGDGFDYATPGSRPWHGVQWLENDRQGRFVFHRIGSFAGAYSPVVVDLDGDGDNDVVAVSGFNDWNHRDAVSLVCFENDGHESFTPRPLAYAPTHLIVVKAGDLDGDGRPELVTGCFVFYPPSDRAGRVTVWQRPR